MSVLNDEIKHKIKTNAARGLTSAMTSEHWQAYKRKKLSRGEKAICEVALPCLLGVLPSSFTTFALHRRQRNRQGQQAADAVDAVGEHGDAGVAHEDPDVLDIVPVDNVPVVGAGGGSAMGPVENAEARRKGLALLNNTDKPPTGYLVVLRMAFSLVESMQHLEFWVSSKRYEKTTTSCSCQESQGGCCQR